MSFIQRFLGASLPSPIWGLLQSLSLTNLFHVGQCAAFLDSSPMLSLQVPLALLLMLPEPLLCHSYLLTPPSPLTHSSHHVCHSLRLHISSVSSQAQQNSHTESLEWWCISIIPALRRGRQEVHKFKASLGYIARPCPKQQMRIVGQGQTC
jgi:hypothetical protein